MGGLEFFIEDNTLHFCLQVLFLAFSRGSGGKLNSYRQIVNVSVLRETNPDGLETFSSLHAKLERGKLHSSPQQTHGCNTAASLNKRVISAETTNQASVALVAG